ncbi:MAG: helix-turn-helix domain-containing protein [Nibricoccus sp.]
MARRALEKSELEHRENDLLRVARRLFLTKGIDGLTMERLAASTKYSKGTVYQHFSSKEDVLAALCVETGKLRHRFLERAALFKGRSRERALAAAKADYLVYRLHPDYWRAEQLMDVLSLTSKISPERRASLDAMVERSAGIALGIIRDGISSGDLVLPAGLTPEKLLMALFGLARGLYLFNADDAAVAKWTSDLPATQQQLFSCACDGFGWHPFRQDWDYDETVQRIWREVFPVEAAQLGLLGKPVA